MVQIAVEVQVQSVPDLVQWVKASGFAAAAWMQMKKKKKNGQLPGGSVVVTAVAQVATVARVWSLVQEFPSATGAAKKKKKKKKKSHNKLKKQHQQKILNLKLSCSEKKLILFQICFCPDRIEGRPKAFLVIRTRPPWSVTHFTTTNCLGNPSQEGSCNHNWLSKF